MLNCITAFKKAAGRITACCLLFFIMLIGFVDTTHAATTMQKNGTQFGSTTVANGIVKTTLSGTVKYIRHAKYTDPNMENMTAYKQLGANGGVIKAFAYNCPGYYLTRIYNDAKGTQLVGVIQIYVAEGEVGNSSKCEPIETPPTPKPAPTTTKINVTHPLPQKTETNNMVVPTVPITEPVVGIEKDPEPVKPKPPQTMLDRVAACQEMSMGNIFQALVKQKSTGNYACVDMELCNGWHAVNGELRWFCYDDNVAEKIYVNNTLPWEVESEPDPTARTTYIVDQCSDAGNDLCAVTMNAVASDGTNCPECEYYEENPRRWWQPIRAYAARRE